MCKKKGCSYMSELHEGDIVYHKETKSRCTIVEMFDRQVVVRTEDNTVIECEISELAIELDTLNVF